MAASTDSLLLPVSVTQRPVSPVANRRLLSRSPQPYRRGQPPERPLPVHCSASHPPSSPEASRAPTCYGGSDSGTEADDELTRRLPAPPARRRISSEDDVWGQKRIGGVLAGARALRKPERSRRLAAAVTRRVIELGLAAVLVAVVLFGRGQRGWVEVLGRRKGSPTAAAATATMYRLDGNLRGADDGRVVLL